jgi:hypothetical protein
MARRLVDTVNKNTGVNRTRVSNARRRAFRTAVKNRYRRKSAGGGGG